MGRSRQQEPQQNPQSRPQGNAAAVYSLAFLLMGAAVPPPGMNLATAVAALLASGTAGAVAVPDTLVSLILRRLPEKDPGGAVNVGRSPFLYRAAYAFEAAKRVTTDIAAGRSVEEALRREARHFAQHRQAQRQREAGDALLKAAAAKYGDVLGWKHQDRGGNHRPSHVAADGKNFRASRAPRLTGAYPATEPNCHCVPVAPFPNAPILS